MALWPKESWNHLRILATTAGTFAAVYVPRPREEVLVLAPDGQQHAVKTIGLADFHLAAEDGTLCVYHARIIEQDGQRQGLDLLRVPTSIPCGVAVGALVTGGTGPAGVAGPPGPKGEKGDQGPPGAAGAPGVDAVALTSEDVVKIAAAVWTLPPPPGYQNISGADLGTLAQEVIAYLLTQRQDVMQGFIRRLDEGALNLLKEGYQPQVTQGG